MAPSASSYQKVLCLLQDIYRGHNLNTEDSNKNKKKNPEENEKKNTEMKLHNITPTFYARIFSVHPSFTPPKQRKTLMFSEF